MTKHAAWVCALALLGSGCPERRKPIALKSKDLGPSVVVVDRNTSQPKIDPTRPELPSLPLDDEKEPDNSLKEAQPITPGRGVRGVLDAPPTEPKQKGDEDWYSFMVPAAGEGPVRLSVAVRAVDAKLAAPKFMLCTDDCSTIYAVSGAKPGETLTMPNFTLDAGRTLFVRIDKQNIPTASSKRVPKDLQPAPPGPIAYELTIVASASTASAEHEPNDSKETAGPIEVGKDWEGYYSRARDEDYYKVKGGATDTLLRVELSAVPGVVPYVWFVGGDAKGTVQARGNKGEELRMRNVPFPKSFDSLLGVRNVEGRNEAMPYVLRISEEAPLGDGAEIEPNDKVDEAQKLTLPEVGGKLAVSGFLWANDQDTFRIEGPDEAVYRVELTVPGKADLRIERLSSTGTVVTKVDQGGAGKAETIEREVRSATPLLRVRGRAKDVLFDEPYTLTLSRIE